MTDIVERLRQVHAEVTESDGGECEYTALHREAADEIERLRGALANTTADLVALRELRLINPGWTSR